MTNKARSDFSKPICFYEDFKPNKMKIKDAQI